MSDATPGDLVWSDAQSEYVYSSYGACFESFCDVADRVVRGQPADRRWTRVRGACLVVSVPDKDSPYALVVAPGLGPVWVQLDGFWRRR